MIDEELLCSATDAADRTLQFCDTVKWSGLSGLRSQLQRAAISVPSNIAEGIGRNPARKEPHTGKEKVRFYLIALGSLRECAIQLELLKRQRTELVNEISSLSGLWVKVQSGILFSVNALPVGVHISKGVHPAERYVGLKDLNLERASNRAVRQALFGFISEAKSEGNVSLLNTFPLKGKGTTYFSFEAFSTYLRKHGRLVSRRKIMDALRSLGWNAKARRFGEKVFRVWMKPSIGMMETFSRRNIAEVARG